MLNNSITVDKLKSKGFTAIHVNQNDNGGYWEYYVSIPNIRGGRLAVSFGDGFADDFLVWLRIEDTTSVAFKYIRTMPQIEQLYTALTRLRANAP